MIKEYLLNLFDLTIGEENRAKVLDNVQSNISFTGFNLWVLACAILIASVGLNVNSTAVIIGAMLISPLMGPIVGAGFALGMYDFELLKKSLLNLFIATIASLMVSTLYFYLSPFKTAQSELLARTSPNIYDILIAFFGGLVGVITITRKEKGNPLPGVAIATALMPPLCTAGFGLATSNIKYFFGALFLYTINCVFICLATFIIVKRLHYPHINIIDQKLKKRIQFIISTLTLLLVIPSVYFAFKLYNEQNFKVKAENFIQKEFHDKKLIYLKTQYNAKFKNIEVAFLDYKPDAIAIKQHNYNLIAFGLENTTLHFIKNPTTIEKETNQVNKIIAEKNQQINKLEKKINEEKFNSTQLLHEIQAFYPAMQSIALAKTNVANNETTEEYLFVFYKTKITLNKEDQVKIKNFIAVRFNTNNVVLSQIPH